MRELQLIDHRLFVAFCYRHLPPPNRKEIINQVTGPRSAFGTSAARRSLAGARICRGVASFPGGEIGSFRSAAGPQLGRLAPQRPKKEQEFVELVYVPIGLDRLPALGLGPVLGLG